MKFDVIIIGGGASGLMAASLLSRKNMRILLLEKNSNLGKKLLITGKGRCNLTNNCYPEDFLKNIPVNHKFMYSAINNFTSQDTMTYFEELGVPLKTERGNRVFPVSDKARDIVLALENDLKKNNVKINYEKVTSLICENGQILGVKCSENSYFSDNVIVATGGKSYPLTGSTGDGYKWAEKLGHNVSELIPSLVPIETREVYDLMGLSLKNVTVTLFEKSSNKPIFKELGEMLFTHFGVSGPLILSASSLIRKINDKNFYLEIDLKPGLTEEQLDRRILRDFDEYKNREIQNVLTKLLPNRLISVIIDLVGLSSQTKINSITKIQRQNLINAIKHFTLNIKSFRPIDEAIITSGGICVKEISPKTMESKLVKGLYFTGEILDVDGYTGGFNLQIAFSTAFLAAQNIVDTKD